MHALVALTILVTATDWKPLRAVEAIGEVETSRRYDLYAHRTPEALTIGTNLPLEGLGSVPYLETTTRGGSLFWFERGPAYALLRPLPVWPEFRHLLEPVGIPREEFETAEGLRSWFGGDATRGQSFSLAGRSARPIVSGNRTWHIDEDYGLLLGGRNIPLPDGVRAQGWRTIDFDTAGEAPRPEGRTILRGSIEPYLFARLPRPNVDLTTELNRLRAGYRGRLDNSWIAVPTVVPPGVFLGADLFQFVGNPSRSRTQRDNGIVVEGFVDEVERIEIPTDGGLLVRFRGAMQAAVRLMEPNAERPVTVAHIQLVSGPNTLNRTVVAFRDAEGRIRVRVGDFGMDGDEARLASSVYASGAWAVARFDWADISSGGTTSIFCLYGWHPGIATEGYAMIPREPLTHPSGVWEYWEAERPFPARALLRRGLLNIQVVVSTHLTQNDLVRIGASLPPVR